MIFQSPDLTTQSGCGAQGEWVYLQPSLITQDSGKPRDSQCHSRRQKPQSRATVTASQEVRTVGLSPDHRRKYEENGKLLS